MTDHLEQRTQSIGRDLFRRVRQSSEANSLGAQIKEQAMSLIMGDGAMKSALFRLVDVLPALKSADQINRHLKEYLGEKPGHMPPLLSTVIKRVPERGLVAKIIARTALWTAGKLGRSFIAAVDPAEAADAALRLRSRGLDFTIDLLGEAVVSEAEADHYAQRYQEMIQTVTGKLDRASFSIKLSGLFSQFDPLNPDGVIAAVAERLRPILRLARQAGSSICFDMEQSAYKDLTLRIFKQILLEPEFHDWTGVAIAIQAYMPESGADLSELASWAKSRGSPVGVRLVKGAYWDYECMIAAQNNWPPRVYTEKSETDSNFERLTEFLIANRKLLRPAIASHNIRAIARTLALAEQHGAGPNDVEYQMLHGMAEAIKATLVDLGRPVRIYMPVGSLLPGTAYLVRRLLENTSNQSFLREAMLEHTSPRVLLVDPATLIKNGHAAKASEFQNEPPTDFSQAKGGASMQRALLEFLPIRAVPVIGGKRVEGGEWLETINPSHKNRSVGQWMKATVEQAHLAIATAKAAYPAWRDKGVEYRANCLTCLADVLRRRRFEIAALEVAECGKPWREADGDIAEAIDFCVYYAQQARRIMSSRRNDLLGETNEYFYEPRGVTVVIAPWNFPLAILCGMSVAALVTGNTVIMKPAEQSSLTGAMLMDAMEQAGFPAGVANYLPGVGEEAGPLLVEHPDVAMIAFTGSRQVGLAIGRAAAEVFDGQQHVKRVIAEMGGKNAIIIDTDADLDEAVTGVAASAFGYAGQKCSACSRVIVMEEIYDAFVARLIEAVKSLRVAPAEDPACFVGPVIDAQAQERILRMIERGKGEAKLLYAGDVGDLAGEGFYVGPHVFGDVSADCELAQEEIFGPVLACMRPRNLDHALELANGVHYALTGGFYSRSPANIRRVGREFRVGDLYINRKITGALVGRQPFGGFKLSGIGSQAGGPDYLLQFLLPRVVSENTLRHGFVPGE